jgi:GABA permease
VDTGQAELKGAVWVWQATVDAAQHRLDSTLQILRSEGLDADGELGDYRPLTALQHAVSGFHPDRIVVATHPEGRSTWLRHGVVDRARQLYDVPVRHIVATAPAALRA